MKKFLLLLAIVVAFSLTAPAQAASSGQAGTQTTTKTTTQSKAKPAGGEAKESQLTGCLAKNAAGNGFMLTNGKYKKGVAVKSSQDLSAHVGHEVKLMGTWEKPTEGAVGTKSAPMRTFNATSMKHISDTCKAAAAGGGEKKGGTKAAEKTPGI